MNRSISTRLGAGLALCTVAFSAFAQAPQVLRNPEVTTVTPVLSQPLRVIAAQAPPVGTRKKEVENHRLPLPDSLFLRPERADPVVQTRLPEAQVATTAPVDFAGIGEADFGYSVNSAPPDTTGAVGTTQYVQWVNTAFAVFDKATGALVSGPVDGNQLFAGLGATHPCAKTNDGDPLVLFDRRASRWVLSQFAVQNPYYQCVAVSKTADATGEYWLYAFRQPQFNDYGKMATWANAYYIAYNMFSSTSYTGARACAMQRARMLSGLSAKQVCFQLSTAHGGLLPADVDGVNQPPSGSPEYFVELNLATGAALSVFRFTVDFSSAATSTLTGPVDVAVAPFTLACTDGGTCVKQSGTTQRLDTLGDRLMYRLAYRRRGPDEILLVNHAVKSGASDVAIRWYELHADGAGGLTVFQQSTFAPDSPNYRWMGSMAMDKQGSIAMGYSASNGTNHPSIRYTGRKNVDPLNVMQAENTITQGGGSQTVTLSRWGDYSTMNIDPVDDCTFWYTTEYLQFNGTFNWHTRIAHFKFPSCT